VNALLERERLGSTAIGKGVAIPHAKAKGIDQVICAFGRSSKGVDFGAEDKEPVHLFFLLLAPLDKAGDHLKALAKIAQLVKDQSFMKNLLAAKDSGGIFNLMKEKDEEVR
jgi:PTS system nitrogen regulatory IIA component